MLWNNYELTNGFVSAKTEFRLFHIREVYKSNEYLTCCKGCKQKGERPVQDALILQCLTREKMGVGRSGRNLLLDLDRTTIGLEKKKRRTITKSKVNPSLLPKSGLLRQIDALLGVISVLAFVFFFFFLFCFVFCFVFFVVFVFVFLGGGEGGCVVAWLLKFFQLSNYTSAWRQS